MNGPSSRRDFLANAAKSLAGGIVAASAIGTIASAESLPALISASPAAPVDPILALCERAAAAWREIDVVCAAREPCEAALFDLQRRNPKPIYNPPPNPKAAVSLTLKT